MAPPLVVGELSCVVEGLVKTRELEECSHVWGAILPSEALAI